MTIEVPCPNCQKKVKWESKSEFRPFCSKRCQLIDLGEWADEGHKISQPVQSHTPMSEEMLDALEDEFLMNNKFFVEPE
ncbi:DNA gyrase inhibitor YacG [Litorilituus lipolyticus]|uniref:DNA gyrase inhibitor YacG n=1 Tax=Litorilituus lipolyticus TaxID=2491017 RepID=A0A502KKV2_9GAMM|nr:DNA gyrase inhibitor YacG [Litorilituus lipolyticus]TPH12046.1 DNA gyrase inhibitor YacG [Litorilituus lipolyticus]